MVYELKNIAEFLGVPEDRLRYARTVILRRNAETPLDESDVLLLLLYHTLVRYTKVERADAAMAWIGTSLDDYAGRMPAMIEERKIELMVVQLFDGRYIGVGPARANVYDLMELTELPKAPVPVTSLAIVLPELYRRFAGAARALAVAHAEAADGPACPPAPSAGS